MVEKARRLRASTTPGRVRGPQGHVTRGTTAAQRMRRVDRWLTDVHGALLRRTDRPLAVDLGFGAEPVTAVEMFTRLRAVNPALELTGLEIDPARVARARERAGGVPGLSWAVGGFELPVPRPPTVVRAFNVLRQYREEDVPAVHPSSLYVALSFPTICAAVYPASVVSVGMMYSCPFLKKRFVEESVVIWNSPFLRTALAPGQENENKRTSAHPNPPSSTSCDQLLLSNPPELNSSSITKHN